MCAIEGRKKYVVEWDERGSMRYGGRKEEVFGGMEEERNVFVERKDRRRLWCSENMRKGVSHQWCDLFSSTTAQLYATHRKRE